MIYLFNCTISLIFFIFLWALNFKNFSISCTFSFLELFSNKIIIFFLISWIYCARDDQHNVYRGTNLCVCRIRKHGKKSPRTLNPSICIRDDDMCVYIFLARLLFFTTRKMRFTWIHGCWFSLSLCFFTSFPFIKSVLKNVSSSMFICMAIVSATMTHTKVAGSLKGKGYFQYTLVDYLRWTLNVNFEVFKVLICSFCDR